MTDTETNKCHNSKTNSELEKMKIIALEKREAILELKLTVAMKELMKIICGGKYTTIHKKRH